MVYNYTCSFALYYDVKVQLLCADDYNFTSKSPTEVHPFLTEKSIHSFSATKNYLFERMFSDSSGKSGNRSASTLPREQTLPSPELQIDARQSPTFYGWENMLSCETLGRPPSEAGTYTITDSDEDHDICNNVAQDNVDTFHLDQMSNGVVQNLCSNVEVCS